MTKATRHAERVEAAPPPGAHKENLRMDFAEKLRKAMVKKNWTQSDLARAAALHSSDKKFGRDLVSGYVRGKYMPHPLHLEALSKALGVARDDLMPAGNLPRAGDVPVPQDVRVLGDGRASLRINQITSVEKAMKILQILNS